MSPGALIAGDKSMVDQADSLQANIDGVSTTTNQLSTSFYALLAWIAIITTAIVVMAVITYRRRRRPGLQTDEAWDSNSNSNISSSTQNASYRVTGDDADESAAAYEINAARLADAVFRPVGDDCCAGDSRENRAHELTGNSQDILVDIHSSASSRTRPSSDVLATSCKDNP